MLALSQLWHASVPRSQLQPEEPCASIEFSTATVFFIQLAELNAS
jgi:hypothetical protein